MLKQTIAAILISFILSACNTQTSQDTHQSDSTSVSEEKEATAALQTNYSLRYIDTIFKKSQIITRLEKYAVRPDHYLTSYSVKVGSDGDTAKRRWVICFFHGGGGDMDDPVCVRYCTRLAQCGYMVLSVNYPTEDPITGDFTPPIQKEAVFCDWSVLQWVRENELKAHVDGSRIFAMGTSAGAVTAFQASIAAWSSSDPNFAAWRDNPNNRQLPITVLGTATISGASSGIYLRLLPKSRCPNAFYSGKLDEKIPYAKQQEQYRLMQTSAIPHMAEPLWMQVSFEAPHTIGHFEDVINGGIFLMPPENVPTKFDGLIKQFYSLGKQPTL